ncbi:hypothetical protein GCM10010429_54960 [Micromonospora olivasterospora]|uniref:TAP-like protein n=2 Tax=Micromonospora olivasterospora TaxID=1880 RepID=A0A562I829_MICOL|nr:TAP-like protein [Micromonospora olivasterospora]
MLWKGNPPRRRVPARPGTWGTALATVGIVVVGMVTADTTPSAASATTAQTPAIDWRPCAQDADAQCGTLSVPIDWDHPKGPRFDLALARRPAKEPAARVGTLVFGPGGPGDSGVSRVVNGISRFSPEIQRRFDIVSFDPRGVGASSPVRCSTDLLNQRPATGYNWATNVARQLGRRGVLLTYLGAGHGIYNATECTRGTLDRYLIDLAVPAPGTNCPAAEPVPTTAG